MTVSKMMNFKKGSIQNMAMLSGVGDLAGLQMHNKTISDSMEKHNKEILDSNLVN